MEEAIIIIEKKILYVSSAQWSDPEEQHLMIELLSNYNDVIWINPFGPANSPILPLVNNVKDSLTIYDPGINFLPMQSMRVFNQKRRYFQVYLYLLERNFMPDMVWTDDPFARPFVERYAKNGALTLYYSGRAILDEYVRAERNRLMKTVDLVYKPSEKPPGLNEEKLMLLLKERLEEISQMVDDHMNEFYS